MPGSSLEKLFGVCYLSGSHTAQSVLQAGKWYLYQMASRELQCQTRQFHPPDNAHILHARKPVVPRMVGQFVFRILIAMSLAPGWGARENVVGTHKQLQPA